ncbi:hypothetical protein FB45DRAFT_1030514 [Roridomyces roridus]|uniref:Secreted protein n=1 Tax=Roridomyces roridus TaxID=1738132 RepID=A0AAD7BKX4_9AGAR|nr:hypothetical protein FB45DRAFT_1030514 [Roridomyces roridus]
MKLASFFVYLFVLALATASSAAHPRQHLDLAARQTQPQPPTGLNNTDLEKSFQSLCSTSSSATGQNAIQADIKFATTVWQLLSEGLLLGQLNLGPCSGPTPSMQGAYNSMIQSWNNVLASSQATATGNIPTPLSQQVLANYSAMANSLEASAQATSQQFTDVMNTFNAFLDLTGECAAIMRANPGKYPIGFFRRQTQAGSQYAALQTQISGFIYHDAVGAGCCNQDNGFGNEPAVSLFSQFAPAVLRISGTGSGRCGRPNRLYHRRKQPEPYAQSQLQNALIQLGMSDQMTQSMSAQVQSFSSIWSAVRSDCEEIAQYITFAEPLAEIPQAFWATLTGVTCVYESMATGMQKYATGLASSGFPKAKRASKDESANFADQLHAEVQALVSSAREQARNYN